MIGSASPSGVVCELFEHNNWARRKLFDAARGLSDDQLDRPFEMGLGCLRRTLHHIWAAERVWLDRWLKRPNVRFTEFEPGVSLEQLALRYDDACRERSDWLKSQTPASLAQSLAYTTSQGASFTNTYLDMLLHVANHGVHHRAQALNMLRRLEAPLPRPGLDYIYMKLDPQASTPPVEFDAETLRRYYVFSDWANQRLLDRASAFSPEQLDRPFPIGIATLRQTLLHIRFAEQWWLENWTLGPGNPFPELPENTSISELCELFQHTARARNQLLASADSQALGAAVHAQPRPDVRRTFALGATMLQTITHGTHHRAQASNMIRILGAPPPELSYLDWLRS